MTRVTFLRDCNPLKWTNVEAIVADFSGGSASSNAGEAH